MRKRSRSSPPRRRPRSLRVASFTEKYTYEDGVEVEVTKIEHGKISRADSEYSEPEAKAGDPYVMLTVRVKNGSKTKIDTSSSWTMTYGADGEEAVRPYIASKSEDETDLSGKILPGRARSPSRPSSSRPRPRHTVRAGVQLRLRARGRIFTGVGEVMTEDPGRQPASATAAADAAAQAAGQIVLVVAIVVAITAAIGGVTFAGVEVPGRFSPVRHGRGRAQPNRPPRTSRQPSSVSSARSVSGCSAPCPTPASRATRMAATPTSRPGAGRGPERGRV